ncbi:DUF4376 domain-containing protein [Salmonella enterica]|uniref:DUF4376 domain-containing protein n=1 Tax=Salmonella enterica TaxID=28901 RepID=UPI0021B48F6A|nr:DUF4376 domain-containing protein [Salmonella enterica]ECS9353310.1 DUF4376 domain-containing protein [Salmonella enterica]EIS4016815.1 DUF4376 domain-containing protein [Salmonella enterica]EKO9193971.1 DUF4376 domain-containing protein [Salmonella enterica]MCT6988733.1 DUF4376 domain-containing protein [Salmonella enterica subsp. enterica serovar Give]MCT7108198.1 DUF4376 domain-containing protein [Salmonella enterica subsp. enterica serovar Give]
MKCAMVNNDNVVENIILCNPAEFSLSGYRLVATENESVRAGWLYKDGVFIAPEKDVTPEMISSARQTKRHEINTWRDQQEDAEITFELNGHRWDAGKLSLSRLEPVIAVANAGQLPENFFWTDADNNDIAVTDKDLPGIYAGMLQAMVVQGFKIHERQRQMKEELDKLKTLDEIRAFSIGW